MKYEDLKSKSDEDLRLLTKKLGEELFHLKLKNKTAQLEKKNRVREARRDIARIATRLTELSRQQKI